MLPALKFRIHATGDWKPGRVRVDWVNAARRMVPQVEQAIDLAWSAAKARLGDKLFDGPTCRLERWTASPAGLQLSLSRTSYRIFLGTNLMNPAFGDEFGIDVLANTVGVSTALETADGWLLLGRRNDSVAYYPNRIHPFAGALEPAENLDVFDEVRRELREELSMESQDIASLRCLGIVEDIGLRQPELIFHAKSALTRMQLEATLDPAEHEAVYAVRAVETQVNEAIGDPQFTPVASASLALWLRANGSAIA